MLFTPGPGSKESKLSRHQPKRTRLLQVLQRRLDIKESRTSIDMISHKCVLLSDGRVQSHLWQVATHSKTKGTVHQIKLNPPGTSSSSRVLLTGQVQASVLLSVESKNFSDKVNQDELNSYSHKEGFSVPHELQLNHQSINNRPKLSFLAADQTNSTRKFNKMLFLALLLYTGLNYFRIKKRL